jgi:drug/metabolite transporter (DMT)-like permease
MTAAALIAVLAAALLHASWNLVLKSSSERLVAASTQVALAGLAFLPILVWRGVPTEVFGFLVVSAIVEVAYIYALATSYDRADLSFVYPIARGSAPVLIALGAFLGLSDQVTGVGWAALALICGGVLTIGLSAPNHRGVQWSLITGLLIATYVTIDGAGVRRTSDALAYTASLYIMTALLLIPVALMVRGPGVVWSTLRADWRRQLLAGMASLGSYSLLLYVSRSAPLSLVSAVRESGVLFATLLGWRFLDERVTGPRWIAVLLIAAGVVVLALSR